jgi:hypothetical protein
LERVLGVDPAGLSRDGGAEPGPRAEAATEAVIERAGATEASMLQSW